MAEKLVTGQRLDDLLKLPKDEYCLKYNIKKSYYPTHKCRIKKRINGRKEKMEAGKEITPEQIAELAHVKDILQACQDAGMSVTEKDAEFVRDIRMWLTTMRDADGEIVQKTNYYLGLGDRKPDLEQSDLIREVPPLIIRPARITSRVGHDKICEVVPDLHGWYRRMGDVLVPTHDEKVVDVGLQIVRDTQPDLIILNGDVLDMPDLGKYAPDSAHFQQVAQAALDRTYEILSQMRASSPNCRLIWLAGNHEERLAHRILEYNLSLMHLKRPGATEKYSWLSIPHLMNLAGIEVEYVSGYPNSSFKVNDRLQVIHGDILRSGGSTAAAVAKAEEMNTVFGHNHRIESHTRTNKLGRSVVAMSFGTWGKIDGTIPGVHNSVSDEGEVMQRYENWQNGMGFIEYQTGDSPFSYQAIPINHTDGYVTRFGGKIYRPSK